MPSKSRSFHHLKANAIRHENQSSPEASKARKPVLPPEIWQSILSRIVRPGPKPHTLSVPGELYHQQELAVCMRVNRAFNAFVSPLLYRTICCYSPSKLFFGLGPSQNRSTPLSTRSSLSKIELLAITTTLHLLTRPNTIDIPLVQLLRSDQWSGVFPPKKDADRMKLYEAEIVRECQDIIDGEKLHEFIVFSGFQVFPKLVRLTSGIVDDGMWDTLEPLYVARHEADLTNAPKEIPVAKIFGAKKLICALLQTKSLRHFCQHICCGPLTILPRTILDLDAASGIRSSTFRDSNNLPTFTSHMSKTFGGLPTLLLGYRNIVSFDVALPRESIKRTAPEYANTPQIAYESGNSINEAVVQYNASPAAPLASVFGSTKLDLYGVAPYEVAGRRHTSEKVPSTIEVSKWGTSLQSIQAEQLAWDQESPSYKSNTLRSTLFHQGPNIIPQLQNAITIHPAASVPVCAACGFTPMEECFL